MAAIGSLLAVLHAWVAIAGAVIAVILVVVGLLDGAGIRRARAWLDRLAAILFVTMVAAVLLGPGIVAGVGMPSSPLHFLLAAIAVLTVPALRFVAIRRDLDPSRLVDGGRCGGDVARAAQPLGDRVLTPSPSTGWLLCASGGGRLDPEDRVVRRVWSSSMPRRQLQVIVLA